MRVQILGPVRAWRGEVELDLGTPHRCAILGLLALAEGHPVSRDELVDALWSERPPASATNIIQTHVKHLRQVLDPDRPPHGPSTVLPRVGDGYALRLDPDAVDLTRFRQLTRAGQSHRNGDKQTAATLLAEALQLWCGPPLAGLPVLTRHPKLVGLVAERHHAVAQYGEAMMAIGAADEALPALEEAAAEQPLDESAQARLIRAYHAAGQPARAFETYHLARHRLADELGVDPGAQLAAAHLALLAGTAPDPAPPPARPAPVPAQLPADVYGFVGRATELSGLDELLEPRGGTGTAVAIAAVSGTAGVGKTALVVHWAHRVRARFPDGQLFLDLRGHDSGEPLSPGDALARLLAALGVPGEEIPLDLTDRAARYRTAVTGRRLLVMLDNAASVDQIRPMLPGSPSCAVVVTSRDSLGGLVALHGARRVDLDLLPMPDALDLLRTLLGPQATADPAGTAALARQCARLPLALRVAAELVSTQAGVPLTDLVAELAGHQPRLELLDVGGDERAAVRTVLSWSYRRLPAHAARAFRHLGLHPGPDADGHAVAALWHADLITARRLSAQLTRASLVRLTGTGRLGMHDLLRAYAVELAEPEEATAALGRLFDYYLATCAAAMDLLHPADRRHHPPPPVPDTPMPPLPDAVAARAWLDTERPTLVALCTYGAGHGFPDRTGRLAATLYRYLEGGHYIDALTIHTHALRGAELSGDPVGQAEALTCLGAVYRLLGRYDEATGRLTRALDLYDGTTHPHGQARALSNLGVVEERTGLLAAAERHHADALTLYRETGDRYGEASTLNNLGAVHALGRADTAAEFYHLALRLYRTLGERVGESIALANLGAANADLGQYELAVEHLHQALTLFRVLGHRYGEANVLNNLGDVDARLGRYQEALHHQQQSLALFRDLGQRYGEAAALNGLGEALLGAGRAAEALARHTDAMAIAVETGDRDEEAHAHCGTGHGYARTGDPAQARAHWQRALTLYTELGAPQAGQVRADLDALGPPAA